MDLFTLDNGRLIYLLKAKKMVLDFNIYQINIFIWGIIKMV